jgi:hypothetical protein
VPVIGRHYKPYYSVISGVDYTMVLFYLLEKYWFVNTAIVEFRRYVQFESRLNEDGGLISVEARFVYLL